MEGQGQPHSSLAARVQREQEFHDYRFEDDVRPANAFYSVNTEAEAAYHEAVRAGCGPGTQVLEYGCGADSLAERLANDGSHVLAIDISLVALRAASEHLPGDSGPSLVHAQMDAHRLGVPDGVFDMVCGSGILHHLDLETAITEVARSLRPSGRAVFLEPWGHNPVINLYRRFTPSQRTADEHPLRVDDLDLLRRHFGVVDHRSFVLTSLVLIVLRGRPGFSRALRWFQRFDRWLISVIPRLDRYAWTTVLDLGEPKKQHAGVRHA